MICFVVLLGFGLFFCNFFLCHFWLFSHGIISLFLISDKSLGFILGKPILNLKILHILWNLCNFHFIFRYFKIFWFQIRRRFKSTLSWNYRRHRILIWIKKRLVKIRHRKKHTWGLWRHRIYLIKVLFQWAFFVVGAHMSLLQRIFDLKWFFIKSQYIFKRLDLFLQSDVLWSGHFFFCFSYVYN